MPLSLKKLPIGRNGLLLGLALGVGLLSAWGVQRYIQGQMQAIESRAKAGTVRVLVPRGDLAKGSVIDEETVAVRAVPKEWAHANAILEAQFERVASQRLALPATGGQMLMWSMLEGQRTPSFSARLTNGRRAITVPVDEVNSISGMLQPGDRIDLMLSAKREAKPLLLPLLQNVVILATGSQAVPASEESSSQTGGRRSYTTITLEVSPDEAQRVLAAREIGKVAALLRAPGDTQPAYSGQHDPLALLLGQVPEETGDGIPVIYGGRSGAEALKSIPPLGTRTGKPAGHAEAPNAQDLATTLSQAGAAAVALNR